MILIILLKLHSKFSVSRSQSDSEIVSLFAGALLLKDILNTKVAAVREPHSPHRYMVSLKGNLSQMAGVPGMAV